MSDREHQMAAEIETLRDALTPFAYFAEMWARKPIQEKLRPEDGVYAIHTGTEWAAEITLGDFQRAARARWGPKAKI